MERRSDRNETLVSGVSGISGVSAAPSGPAVTAGPTLSSAAIGDAPASLAMWLRAGRVQRGMSLDDVAKVTKIQPRILERLEAGKLDGLPAEVFVRGFVRSVARCLGLDEGEALRRHAACGSGLSALGSVEVIPARPALAPATRALVEAM